MPYSVFHNFVFTTFALWLLGCLLYRAQSRKKIQILGDILILLGWLVLVGFLVLLWIYLGRAPLRTMGETRLWYGILLPLVGIVVRFRWKLKWFLVYSLCMAALFLSINLANPELFDKTLMPALKSPWFIPHVIVYIEAYALLAAATLFAFRGLVFLYEKRFDPQILARTDTIVYLGYAFLSFGLLFGALWAKEAWGHYWTWDPKETWAFITWLSYLVYIHLRFQHPTRVKLALGFLIFNFIILLLCWFGVNYLPSTQDSIHIYSS